jgi:hypothetical protein
MEMAHATLKVNAPVPEIMMAPIATVANPTTMIPPVRQIVWLLVLARLMVLAAQQTEHADAPSHTLDQTAILASPIITGQIVQQFAMLWLLAMATELATLQVNVHVIPDILVQIATTADLIYSDQIAIYPVMLPQRAMETEYATLPVVLALVQLGGQEPIAMLVTQTTMDLNAMNIAWTRQLVTATDPAMLLGIVLARQISLPATAAVAMTTITAQTATLSAKPPLLVLAMDTALLKAHAVAQLVMQEVPALHATLTTMDLIAMFTALHSQLVAAMEHARLPLVSVCALRGSLAFIVINVLQAIMVPTVQHNALARKHVAEMVTAIAMEHALAILVMPVLTVAVAQQIIMAAHANNIVIAILAVHMGPAIVMDNVLAAVVSLELCVTNAPTNYTELNVIHSAMLQPHATEKDRATLKQELVSANLSMTGPAAVDA